ncbi:MAG TPA: carboxy-S-adenosyl-L-methionine synthase CmoA [Anaerolineae bacterium]|nr:carboxy-S-adenosyl-L-methionine synthase CmoA [Anaerolineae bacterium]
MIYSQPQATVADFVFDQRVAAVFPDMIKRSVPGYEQMVAYTGLWAARFAQADSVIYDLGCSLGATTAAIRQHVRAKGCRIVGVDNSAEMLKKCQTILDSQPSPIPFELLEADLQTIPIKNASVVVLNFTLQFIAPSERDSIIAAIYAGLNAGGILIVAEKVVFERVAWGQLLIDVHHDFKRAQGYSALEVAQKRKAIEDVLIPETVETHLARMKRVGFEVAEQWFQALNFVSLVGIKKGRRMKDEG